VTGSAAFFSRLPHARRPRDAQPRPLTRAILQAHARDPRANPSGLAWNDRQLVVRCQRARIRAAARAATARERARAGAEREAARAAVEAERVEAVVQNLALCHAFSDSREVMADIEAAEERDWLDSRPGGRAQRERAERGWVPTSRIITPTERYALRSALARRAYLGERMSLDAEYEEHYGRAMGRWVFDIWVAQAASSTAFGPTDHSGAGERVGAVWLGPPAGSEDGDWEWMESDDGIEEFHFVPDGDAADGVGEGWVEWVEGRRNGRFVVNDVFR
jgi:hypothetical protein